MEELDALLPATSSESHAEWEAPNPAAVEDKVLAEAAILLHVTSRVRSEGLAVASTVDDAYQRLRDALVARARPDRHWKLLGGAPQIAWPVGLTHAVLHRHEAADGEFDSFLEECLALGWNGRVDRPIFRALEIGWARAVRHGHRPEVDDLLKLAPLAKTLPALVARREDVYALTHTLFYATDFGAYRLPMWIDVESTASCVDSFLAWQMWEDDLDLLGELLAGVYACHLPSRYATTALSVVWNDLCTPAVRGPFATQVRHKLDSPHDSEVFRTCYHTTLVAGILCAAILTGSFPDSHKPRPDRELVKSESLACLRIANQPARLHAAWTTRIDAVADTTEHVLACVLDGAIVTAFRAGELTAVVALQDLGRRHGWATTATSLAATKILDLQARVSQSRANAPA
ncbi:DUF6895 family protein [Streptomyces sp. NBC_00481]|uniref:DUF6895 family protein n=1 Tax=unclassified Streptomyces TaxID=2593676 RepID=UPI003FA37D3F